jgi:GDP-D-mannose 3',5'-epimerase
MNEKIVVCGAAGFVGGHLVRYLVKQGHTNIRAVSSRPIRDWISTTPGVENLSLDLRRSWEASIATQDAMWIYNLAAKVGGISYIGENRWEPMVASTININLLRSFQFSNQMKGYFFASSACVYGSCKETGGGLLTHISEDDNLEPSKGYGEEKVFSERVCQEFHREFGAPVKVARFSGVYGPGDGQKGKENKDHVIAALCRKVIAAKRTGNHEIEIWGDGSQVRDFLYIDDCVEGAYRLMNCAGLDSRPVNIGGGTWASINGVLEVIQHLSGIGVLSIKRNRTAPTGVQNRILSNRRLQQFTGWTPGTTLFYGIKKVYESIENES